MKNSLVCFLLLLGLKFIWIFSMFMLRVSIVTFHSTSAMKTLNHRLLLLLVLLDDDIWILMKINHDFLVYQIYTVKIATQMAISAASLRTFLHINSEELGGTTSISVKNVLSIFLFHWLLDDSFRIIITTDISTPFALFSATLHGDSCMRFNNARDNSFLRPITKKNTCRLILEANISRLLWGCWEISLEMHGSASGKWTEFSRPLRRVFPSHSVDARVGWHERFDNEERKRILISKNKAKKSEINKVLLLIIIDVVVASSSILAEILSNCWRQQKWRWWW